MIRNAKCKMQNAKLGESKKLIFAFFLIILGVLFRTVWHMGDNVEFVTSATLLASCYLGWRYALAVAFFIMAIADFFIGNTNIVIFTWSAYIVVGIIGWEITKIQKSKFKSLPAQAGQNHKLKVKIIATMTGMGILASCWFFLWTNFGVWLLDSWGMYPKTLSGLYLSYIMGIPFLKNNLTGNIILVPSSFFVVELGRLFISNYKHIFFRSKKEMIYGHR